MATEAGDLYAREPPTVIGEPKHTIGKTIIGRYKYLSNLPIKTSGTSATFRDKFGAYILTGAS